MIVALIVSWSMLADSAAAQCSVIICRPDEAFWKPPENAKDQKSDKQTLAETDHIMHFRATPRQAETHMTRYSSLPAAYAITNAIANVDSSLAAGSLRNFRCRCRCKSCQINEKKELATPIG